MSIREMKRSAINPLPDYFGRYIGRVWDTTLDEAFELSLKQIDELDLDLLERIGNRTYAPGKWALPTIITHLTDFERILGYRALVYARGAGIVPQGVEEDTIAANSRADRRSVRDTIAELREARISTRSMFAGFDDEALATVGRIWKDEMTVLTMGFNILGHQVHHFAIIEERYFALAGEQS